MGAGAGDAVEETAAPVQSAAGDKRFIVAAAITPQEVDAAVACCDERYRQTYASNWISHPDVFFAARNEQGEVVATAGLEFGWTREAIDCERYFLLTPRMRRFIREHRNHVAEFGRFSSREGDSRAAQAVLHAVITYCQQSGVDYLFAWANSTVYEHGAERLGVPFWVIDVGVNEHEVRNDTHWAKPPVKFFLREDPPKLLLAVIPFFDHVNDRLSKIYGEPLSLVS